MLTDAGNCYWYTKFSTTKRNQYKKYFVFTYRLSKTQQACKICLKLLTKAFEETALV